MVRWQVRSGEVVLQHLEAGRWKDVRVVDEQGKDLPGLPQAVKFEPDDVVVVRLGYDLAQRDRDQMARRLAPVFPDNKVLILNSGMSIEVARSDQGEGESL